MRLLTAATALALFFVLACGQGQAQSTPQFEIGGHFFSLGNHDIGYGQGAGGRFTYYVKDYLAVDSEIDAFWGDDGSTYATQGQFGAMVGKRTKHFGVFAKARPGYSTFFVVNNDYHTRPRFVFDVGGVVEGYPTRHLVLRLDVGDTILPLGAGDTVDTGRRLLRGAVHNSQVSFGLGVRF